MPQKVTCKVVETEPVVKGQTAANSFKPAVLDNGVRVMIPPFVGTDEDIIVNTETIRIRPNAPKSWAVSHGMFPRATSCA